MGGTNSAIMAEAALRAGLACISMPVSSMDGSETAFGICAPNPNKPGSR
jgi:hypothetical protein